MESKYLILDRIKSMYRLHIDKIEMEYKSKLDCIVVLKKKTGVFGEKMDYKLIQKDFNEDVSKINETMTNLDIQVNNVLKYLNLPTTDVVTEVCEREFVYSNLLFVFGALEEKPQNQLYLSRFVHACADGLFDAALNYLWNATVEVLRQKVIEYDIVYFYDLVYSDAKLRKNYKGESDITKVSESELLQGIKQMDFINDTEYQQLMHINYMRNWSSAAHPNRVTLDGPTLISYLNQCFKIVFNMQVSSFSLQISTLLRDIKSRKLDTTELNTRRQIMIDLPRDKANGLIQGFFGIYTDDIVSQDTMENIHALAPTLWTVVDEPVKTKIGLNYAQIKINGTTQESYRAEAFLEVVKGKAYIPDIFRVAEIDSILDELQNAHKSGGNFYSEPVVVQQLILVTSNIGVSIPKEVKFKYVTTLVNCFLTNGFGEAWNAQPYYLDLINNFTKEEAELALLSFFEIEINQKLNYTLCITKFKEMLEIIRSKFTGGQYNDFIDYLVGFGVEPLTSFLNDQKYKHNFENFIHSLQSYNFYINNQHKENQK